MKSTALPGTVLQPLAKMTTLRIGGPARICTIVERAALAALPDLGPCRWLGRGANLLIGDEGVSEPVLRLGGDFDALAIEPLGDHALLRVGAAVNLTRLISTCMTAGLAGPEALAGVPASVGGALCMNAGTSTGWIFDLVRRVEVLLPGQREPCWLARTEVPAVYRSAGLPAGTVYLACEMLLPYGNPAVLRARANELKRHKAASQPLSARSAGCTFKNPAPDLPAGRLLDELGCKGLRVGALEVSPVHANFLVNLGEGRAADAVELIVQLRRRAWRERGIVLELEVETWNCSDRLRSHPEDG